MAKFKLLVFLTFFFISHTFFSQVVEEQVQLDTTFETIKVIYKPTISSTYYFKKVAVFADDTSKIAIEKSFTSYGQNGVYKVYYPSGRLKIKTVFANNKINGEWTWYDEEGIILIKGVYKEGVKDGYWAYKFLKIYGRYKKGLKNSKWKRFDANHKKYTSRYKKGVLIRGEGYVGDQVLPETLKDSLNNGRAKEKELEGDNTQINREYDQAISFLTENIVFKKAIKAHFGSTLKEIRGIKKYFKKGKFQFVISSSILSLGISTFVKESQEGKILVEKIDSVLKYNPDNLNLLFFKEGLEEKNMFYQNSTNVISPMAVYFSKIHQNLLRVDVIKYDTLIGKDNLASRYKTAKEIQKFRILLYYNEEGELKGAEYQKP